jgi:polyisoprenoid-binding protein YceI/rhodanese-related sulfurtransferase
MSDTASYGLITGASVFDRLRDGTIRVLDVLPEEQHVLRHIPGAANACVYEVTFPDQVAKAIPDRHNEIVVYGATADSREADAAAEKLVRLGYEKVLVLEGGLAGWMEAGYELEGQDTSVPAAEALLVLEEREYGIDPDQSRIEWAGRNANSTHFGTVKISEGRIVKAQDGIAGRFVVDMQSIQNLDLEGDELHPVLLAHLNSDDFFFVKMFPTAVFTIKSARPVSQSAYGERYYEVLGELELRGVKGELTFQATVGLNRDSRLSVEAHFDLDRTRFGVLYGAYRFFQHLGMHLVYDSISIGIRLVAN